MNVNHRKKSKKINNLKLSSKIFGQEQILKSIKNNRYLFYSLGLGFLLLGYFVPFAAINNLSPANQSMSKTKNNDLSQSPVAQRNKQGPSAYRKTTNSLSPKNKAAFHSLSSSDKKRVVDASQQGKGHHELHKVLKEDQKNYDQNKDKQGMSGNQTPASVAIDKHMKNVKSKQQENIYE